MGTSRGSGRTPLAIDERVWASESDGEDQVLAEFADESSVDAGVPQSTRDTFPRCGPRDSLGDPTWRKPLRVLSAHTPMREVVRTVLIGCLSAMALGASFAIGFGYVWSDLGSTTVPAGTRPVPDVLPVLPLVPTAGAELPAALDGTAASSRAAAEATESPSVPAAPAERESTAVPADGAANEPNSGFGVPLPAAAPDAAAAPGLPAAAEPMLLESTLLLSKPLPSAEGAVVARPVVPASPASPDSPRVAGPIGRALPPAPRSDLQAVRDAIDRYQSAYARKDVGAMALVWPTLDIAGAARAFEDVDRQVLTFNDCHVTTAGRFATAVCPGQVRYVGRVGNSQMQSRRGTWTIALERSGDTWQFTRLNVR